MPIEEMASFFEHPFLRTGIVEERGFQIDLARHALEKKRTLIVAPTALGKTVIAVLWIALELEKRPVARVLFLAPTRPLAEQHHRFMQKALNLPDGEFALLTGATSSAKRWKQAEMAQIVCATPQTIESDVLIQKRKGPPFDLVVFDEAHRAVGDYAYVALAKHFFEKDQSRFLALTASPGGTEEKIRTVCENLFIESVQIKRNSDTDLAAFVKPIETEFATVELPPEMKAIKRELEGFLSEQLEGLKKIGLVHTTNLKYFSRKRQLELQASIRKRLIAHGKSQPSLFSGASKTSALLKVSHAHTLLETQGLESLFAYFTRLETEAAGAGSTKSAKLIVHHPLIQNAIRQTRKGLQSGLDHPKKIVLANILSKQFEQFPDSRVIVFNHYRDQINTIVLFLNKIEGIRARKFIGQADRENDDGMNQKEQISTLEELRAGAFNTLVASSVAEEGLDIPTVDLVVFFDPVPSEIRSIQRRGRTGRWNKGRTITLITKGTRDEAYYFVSKAKEKLMHATLSSMAQAPAGKNAFQHAENATGKTALDLRMHAIDHNAAANRQTLETAIEPSEELDRAPNPRAKNPQTTLNGFATDHKPNEIRIIVDWREQNTRVVRTLAQTDAKLEFKTLDVGDYVVAQTIGVERKTVDDFLQSMIDGRLFEQVGRLKRAFERPFLILEGDPRELFVTRNIHPNAILGCLTSLAVRYRLPVLFSQDAEQTAALLFVTAKREQTGKNRDIALQHMKKTLSLAQRQRLVVESLPHVGPRMAKALLKQFGSVRNLANAPFDELVHVENMGDKKAKRILRVLRGHYEEKPNSEKKAPDQKQNHE